MVSRLQDLAGACANVTLPVNVLSILKNPMILLGLVSMGIFFGMPYLVDNSRFFRRIFLFAALTQQPTVDPEMKKEWEESQKSNPMNSLMGGQQGTQNPMGNFDMAAFLAGSSKDNNGNGGSKKGAKK